MVLSIALLTLGAAVARSESSDRPYYGVKNLELTGDQPLPIHEARKLARWWHQNGWSADLSYAYNTPGGTKLYHVRAMKELDTPPQGPEG